MIALDHYLMVAGALLALGWVGMIMRRQHVIFLLICLELMLLAVNINWIAFSGHWHTPTGGLFVLFILTVAAAEAAVGLALVVLLFRCKGRIDVQSIRTLKG